MNAEQAATEGSSPDHPNLRAQRICPLCGGSKDVGLVVCWPCYRAYDLRNGNPEVGRLLDLAEFSSIKPGPNDAKGE